MAKVTSGSFNTSAYGSRYLVFSWTCSQDTATNTTTINWTLKGAGGTTTSYYKAAPFSVTIDGTEVYKSTTRIQLFNGTVVASGTKKLTHNTDGTKSFSASVKAAIYSASNNVSGSGSWDLKDIPRKATITAAEDFTDEENPVITYNSPAGNSVTTLQACISFDKSTDNIAYRNISKTGTSYTFSLTDAEREVLRNATTTSNTKTVYFYIKTVIGDDTFYNSVAKTLTIANANPTMTASVVDVAESSTVLTGNSATMIKGFNNMSASMAVTLKKGATIKSYEIKNGSNTISAASGSFMNTENNVFVFTATDSRGNKAEKTITIPMVNYVKLTANIDGKIALNSTDNTKADLTFTISGNYFSGSFGAKDNSLEISYVLEDSAGGNYTEILTIPEGAINGNTYSINHTVTDLEYQNSYTVKATIKDAISSVNSASKPFKTIPVFDWSEEDFNFNVPVAYKEVKLFYTTGDSIDLAGARAVLSGAVSNSTKTLYFTIPLTKPIFANGASFSGKVIARGVNGYINGTTFSDTTAIDLAGGTDYTVTTYLSPMGLDINITFAAAITNATNNTPVNLQPYGTLNITFT